VILIIAVASPIVVALKIVLMILAAVVALSVVIVIHELGHFLTARRAGVKVEAFSIGFGPRIWGVKKGETDYRVSLFLFGGYVKMKGMESEGGKQPHEIEGGFFAAKPGRRALIAVAGPAMNVLLALAVFTLLCFTGRKVAQGFLESTVGYLEEKSPLRKVGIVPGDTILNINGQAVHEWKDVMGAVAFSPSNTVDLTIKHNGTILNKRISVERDEELGFRHLSIYPRMDSDKSEGLLVSEIEKGSLADELALRKGDRLFSLAGERLYHIDQFRELLLGNIGKEIELAVRRGAKRPRELTLSFRVPLPENGIQVTSVRKGSIAQQAGLRNGDVIVKASEHEIFTVSALAEVLSKNPGKKIKLEVLRGKHRRPEEEPPPPPTDTLLGADLKEGFPILGFVPDIVYGAKREDPFSATYFAVKNALLTLKGLMTRTVSTKGISGPVGIVGMIAKSILISFTTFLYFIGFLSANFAIINLLPIPIVDGGHIMFCGIEKVRKKPIPQKIMTALINVFFVLILAFFVFVTRNDIMKFFQGRGKESPDKKAKILWLNVPEAGVSRSADQGENSQPKQ